jgi:D-3-phosphoglycerate dehydrogenase
MKSLPDNIIIDFDSTVVKHEGMEELARIALADNPDKESILSAVKTLTQMGMEGSISFPDSLTRRLQLFGAKREDVQGLVEFLRGEITPSFHRNADKLKSIRDRIVVISGGFKGWVVPISELLGLHPVRVFANDFLYDDFGNIVGADHGNLLAQEGGKQNVTRNLNLKGDTVVIGDGCTDYSIKEAGLASCFYLFVENTDRDSLREKADVVLYSMDHFFEEFGM